MGPVRRGLACAALVVLAGCSSAEPEEPAATGSTTSGRDEPPVLVALGDSITAGFGACGQAEACTAASWVTGETPEVDSLRSRLADSWEVPSVEGTNLARAGARAADLPDQAARLPEGADALVTVLVGANDVCSGLGNMTAPEQLRASVDRTLQVIAERAPDAVVLVASVPDVVAVEEVRREAGGDAPGGCRSLAGPADAEATAQVAERVEQYNAQLQQACSAAPACVFDDGAVYDVALAASDLSEVDRFHPSLSGQAQLAGAVWDAAVDTPATRDLLVP